MPMLVTGFLPFGGQSVNASEILVASLVANGVLPGAEVMVLPVEFEGAWNTLEPVLRARQPECVIAFGEATADVIRLERVARNRDGKGARDEVGRIADGSPITPGGREERSSGLPLDRIGAALTASGVPWTFSDDAGGHLCNHIFYRLMEWSARHGVPCGFIHVPTITMPGWTPHRLATVGQILIGSVMTS